MTFKEIQINNIIYCVFTESDNLIVPLQVDDIIKHDGYYSFKGTSLLTGSSFAWGILASDLNKETAIDASTTIEGAKKIVIHNCSERNKAIRQKKWKNCLKT